MNSGLVPSLNREFLVDEYLKDKKSIKKIAQECGVSYTTIRYWLIKLNVLIRSKSEALRDRKLTEKHRNNISIGRKELLLDKTRHPNWMGGPVEVICETCGKRYLIKRYKYLRGIGRFCSRDCYVIHQRQNTVEASLVTRERMSISRKKYIEVNGCYMTGQRHTEEARRKVSATKQGIRLDEWSVFSSYEPYPVIFNFGLKEEIRNRDNRMCVLCGKSELLNCGRRLAVHHINGNKRDCSKTNLVSLCISCNSKLDTIEKEFLITLKLGGIN